MKLWPLLALFVFMVGCDDSPKNNDQPATEDEILDAQAQALDGANPLDIKAGQFVYVLKTQELHSSQEPIENLIEETGISITEREEFGDYFDITVIKEVIDHIAKDKPHYKFKNIYTIDYPATASTPVTPASSNKLLLKQLKDKVHALAESNAGESQLSYYNLKIVKEKIPPPSKVLEHTPCAEGADCRINVTKLFYDIVISTPGEDPQRNQFEVWISSEVPYFATILKSCVMGLVKVDTAVPLIRQCESVYDYRFEAPPTP